MNSQINFCTLFDRNYLFKGLALLDSLMRTGSSFRLWILCCDDIVLTVLRKMDLKNVVLISLREFEDEELLKIKQTRSPVEYYWTCTPSLPLFVLNREPGLDMITYIDADLYFYSDPKVLFGEFGGHSIGVIEHKYSPDYQKREKTSGRYNVEFLVFRNDANALECLKWWRERCNEWCFFKHEDGKFGDQKYLDEWEGRFKGFYVLQHKGAGVAPWNVRNYAVRNTDGTVTIDGQELVFYHFHQLNILKADTYDLTRGYILGDAAIDLIYRPYVLCLEDTIRYVQGLEPGYRYGFGTQYYPRPTSLEGLIKHLILKNKLLMTLIRKYLGWLTGKKFYVYTINNKQGLVPRRHKQDER